MKAPGSERVNSTQFLKIIMTFLQTLCADATFCFIVFFSNFIVSNTPCYASLFAERLELKQLTDVFFASPYLVWLRLL